MFTTSQFSGLESRDEPFAVACLRRIDFHRARAWPAFSVWTRYVDFLRERDALLLSYAAAGATATPQRVPLDAFEGWTRLTGAPKTLDGLDAFAAHWRWRALHPEAPTTGRLGEPGQPEQALTEGSAQCVRIGADVYHRWRDDFDRLGLFAPPSLAVYAAHVVECCISWPRAMRRPAPNSA